MKSAVTLCVVVACVALLGCGDAGKKPARQIQEIHLAAASVLAERVNLQVPAEGPVLLVHRQASEEIADSWREGLSRNLDERFTLVECGINDLSAEAAESFEGVVPLGEAIQNHGGQAVAVITAIDFDPRQYRELPQDHAPLFALEWPFLDAAGPLLNAGLLQAGIFERERRGAAPESTRGASMEDIMGARYLLATPENWQEQIGQ